MLSMVCPPATSPARPRVEVFRRADETFIVARGPWFPMNLRKMIPVTISVGSRPQKSEVSPFCQFPCPET